MQWGQTEDAEVVGARFPQSWTVRAMRVAAAGGTVTSILKKEQLKICLKRLGLPQGLAVIGFRLLASFGREKPEKSHKKIYISAVVFPLLYCFRVFVGVLQKRGELNIFRKKTRVTKRPSFLDKKAKRCVDFCIL